MFPAEPLRPLECIDREIRRGLPARVRFNALPMECRPFVVFDHARLSSLDFLSTQLVKLHRSHDEIPFEHQPLNLLAKFELMRCFISRRSFNQALSALSARSIAF